MLGVDQATALSRIACGNISWFRKKRKIQCSLIIYIYILAKQMVPTKSEREIFSHWIERPGKSDGQKTVGV